MRGPFPPLIRIRKGFVTLPVSSRRWRRLLLLQVPGFFPIPVVSSSFSLHVCHLPFGRVGRRFLHAPDLARTTASSRYSWTTDISGTGSLICFASRWGFLLFGCVARLSRNHNFIRQQGSIVPPLRRAFPSFFPSLFWSSFPGPSPHLLSDRNSGSLEMLLGHFHRGEPLSSAPFSPYLAVWRRVRTVGLRIV